MELINNGKLTYNVKVSYGKDKSVFKWKFLPVKYNKTWLLSIFWSFVNTLNFTLFEWLKIMILEINYKLVILK